MFAQFVGFVQPTENQSTMLTIKKKHIKKYSLSYKKKEKKKKRENNK